MPRRYAGALPPPPDGPQVGQALQPCFVGGELAPALYARFDLSKFHIGAKQMLNCFAAGQGGAYNRAGTQFLAFAKYPPPRITRLIAFNFSVTQTYVLEFGYQYVRFITQGAYVVNGSGAVYEVATPYLDTDLALLKFAQANDVLTLTHPSYAPMDLNRLGVADWTLTAITFATSAVAPTAPTVTPVNNQAVISASGANLPTSLWTYVVTTVTLDPPDESLPSPPTGATNYDLGYWSQFGVSNTIAWPAVAGADHYNVYRLYQGVYGFIGSTTALTLNDRDTLPDINTTPPNGNADPFASGNNPGCVAYYQQRRVFAGSADDPDSLWMTRTGNITSMNVSYPVRPDDAITATIAAQQDNTIQHIVPVQDLLLMTSGGCWKVGGGAQGNVVTPAGLVVQPQIFNGSAPTMPPIVINYDILYVQEKGCTIRDLSYNFYVNLYTGTDITLLAWHLFFSYTLSEWAFAREPFKIVWVVRSDGMLLGLTYLKDQDVYAWTRHTTLGQFMSVATVGEGTEDVPYFAVQRTLGGVLQTCIERMHSRQLGVANADVTQGWFVDCGLQYSGSPVSSVGGLAYLAGQTVSILADGSVLPQQVVPSNGVLMLPQAASTITVGLPYQTILETLPLDLGQPTQQGKRKRISRVRAFVENTRGLKAGPVHPTKGPLLTRFKERRGEAWGAPTALQTGEEWINAVGNWDIYGSVWFQQDDPLPMGLLGVELDFELGT